MTMLHSTPTAAGSPSRPGRRFSAHLLYVPALLILATSLALAGSIISAWAQETAENWPELPTSFESTGGGGWMITEYRPVVAGDVCRTDFVAVSPDGKERFANVVEWTASPRDGGVMCTGGRWRAKAGDASGTTPLEVFIKDGVVRRAP